jgi:hypothetical protein
MQNREQGLLMRINKEGKMRMIQSEHINMVDCIAYLRNYLIQARQRVLEQQELPSFLLQLQEEVRPALCRRSGEIGGIGEKYSRHMKMWILYVHASEYFVRAFVV